jgi:hypothetical protein
MTRKEMKKKCPFVCGTENLFKSKDKAFKAQAKFFKDYPFVFDMLPRNHAYALKLRFGIGGEPLIFEHIGIKLGISKERARQIVDSAIEELSKDKSIEIIQQCTEEYNEGLMEEFILGKYVFVYQ